MKHPHLYLRELRIISNLLESYEERRCKYCDKKATRLHARHDNGELENLCEDHYSRWHKPLQEKLEFVGGVEA